jgi:hypothetical protein
MIIAQQESNVQIGGTTNTSVEFRIKASAKAFAILSSNMYKNKIRAIVREVSSNARDGHRAVGKLDVPFDVHLPTQLEPSFYVRDYGIGLNQREIEEIYTVYFESTKAESNDDVGGLGLGAKSPFSYTKNFTVTSIKDGIKTIYSAFINDKGMPSILQLLSSESDEPTGVEVRVPVDSSDFYKFRNEAEYVYSVYDVKPNILGAQISIPVIQYHTENIIEGTHYVSNNHPSSGAVAVMGSVVYPLNAVPNADENFGVLADMLDEDLIITFGIGELDIAPSREELSYDDATINAIKNKLIKISQAITPKLKDKLDAEQNAWELYKVLKTYSTSSLYKGALMELIKSNNYPFTDNVTGQVLYNLELGLNSLESMNINANVYTGTYTKTSVRQMGISTRHDGAKYYKLPMTSKFEFITNEKNSRIASRLKKHLYANKDTCSVILTPIDAKKPMMLDRFAKLVYDAPIKSIDILPTIDKTPRATIGVGGILRASCVTSTMDYMYSSPKWESVSNIDEMLKDDCQVTYYVPIKARKIDCRFFGLPRTLYEYMDFYSNTGIKNLDNIQIFGVVEKHIKDIKDNSNWINFEDLVEQEIKDLPNNKELIVNVARGKAKNISQFVNDLSDSVDNNSPLKRWVSRIKLLVDGIQRKSTAHGLYNIINRFGNISGYEDYITKFTDNVKKTIEEVDKQTDMIYSTYPLLDHVSQRDSVVGHLVRYVKAIDLLNTTNSN